MSLSQGLSPIWHDACIGVHGALLEGWQRCAEALSTALHPIVDRLVIQLNELASSATPIFSTVGSNVTAVLSLEQIKFATDGAESLHSVLQDKLKWVPEVQQFANNWNKNERMLRRQLPDICKAITQWQQSVIHQWEATGYRHNAPKASQLTDQRPVRLHVDGVFVADALDSADLACLLLHDTHQSAWSGLHMAISTPGTHQLTISRYVLQCQTLLAVTDLMQFATSCCILPLLLGMLQLKHCVQPQ